MFHSDRQMRFSFLEDTGCSSGVVGAEAEEGTHSLRGRDDELVRFCQKSLQGLGLDDLRARISVEWNGRMRSCAGRAYWPKGLVQLNPRLAGISKSEIRQTLLHELAHLVAYERHKNRRIKGHGKEWQQACSDVGIPGEKATHQLALPSRRMKRKWRYHCPECQRAVERVRRFKSAVACHHCCSKKTGGVYDESYRLMEVSLEP